MIEQMIFRITKAKDVEILAKESEDTIIFKNLSLDALIEILKQEIASKSRIEKETLQLLHPQIIALGQRSCLIKQEEHEKIVTFKDKAYKIKMANSVYFMEFEFKKEIFVQSIVAFSYKLWEQENTKLFKYPMPNMLYDNKICIGSAPRVIKDHNYVEALEKIIFTQYTHQTFDDVKGFKNTVAWFEHLEKNEFPYDLLIPLNRELKSELKG